MFWQPLNWQSCLLNFSPGTTINILICVVWMSNMGSFLAWQSSFFRWVSALEGVVGLLQLFNAIVGEFKARAKIFYFVVEWTNKFSVLLMDCRTLNSCGLEITCVCGWCLFTFDWVRWILPWGYPFCTSCVVIDVCFQVYQFLQYLRVAFGVLSMDCNIV